MANISEGRDPNRLHELAAACGSALLDVHSDPDHHRSVFTMAGASAVRALADAAVRLLDLREHSGVHPRIGVVDVVPFVPFAGAEMSAALTARDSFAEWIWSSLGVPAFLYGPERTLPEVRRLAAAGSGPDVGSGRHPSAGAVAVGAREVLVAYNLWLASADLTLARSIVRGLRRPAVRALALEVGSSVQVSMNLVQPSLIGPMEVYDEVAVLAEIERAELVGLLPASVLEAIPRDRWSELDLDADRTIEARVAGS